MITLQNKFNKFTTDIVVSNEEFKKAVVCFKEVQLFTFKIKTSYISIEDFILTKKRSDLEKQEVVNSKIAEVLANVNVLNEHRVKFLSEIKLKGQIATFQIQVSLHLPNVKDGAKPHEVHFADNKVITTKQGFFKHFISIDINKESVIETLVKFVTSFTVKSEKMRSFTPTLTSTRMLKLIEQEKPKRPTAYKLQTIEEELNLQAYTYSSVKKAEVTVSARVRPSIHNKTETKKSCFGNLKGLLTKEYYEEFDKAVMNCNEEFFCDEFYEYY